MKTAIWRDYGFTAVLRLEKAVHRLAHWDQKSALVEDIYDSSRRALSLANLGLKFGNSHHCSSKSTS